jgi:hypothetical protein
VPGSSRLLAWSMAIALGWPVAAMADYRAYARGQEAAADANWAEVEREMQLALAGNPVPKVRVKLYGQRFAPYVPQYYLGLAAYRQGDCTAAMRWFGDASAAAVIAQLSEFKGVADAARSDCTARLAANKPAPTQPAAEPPAKPVVATPAKPVPATDKPVVQTPPPVKPTPPATKPEPAAPAAPAALQTALQHWLSGRYREVVAGSTSGVQGKALAHLHLVRAAAYFAQSEIDPANAAALRGSAEQEVRSARRALPAIAPDAGFHSPRFRNFFAGLR